MSDSLPILRSTALGLPMVLGLLGGCYVPSSDPVGADAATKHSMDPGLSVYDGGIASQDAGTGNGLPSAVAAVLADKCQSCHGNPPSRSAPMPLVTYPDLTSRSQSNPSLTYAEQSLAR